MMATQMLKNGYKPGKVLGASVQGITELITVYEKKDTFFLGFKATKFDLKWVKAYIENG